MKRKIKFCALSFFMAIYFSVSQVCFAQNTVPKISVIIPVYKVEKYIGECLDSVVNQTIKDIEIICVDDGSPDKCPQILDEYAKKDKRIKVIHQKNKGLPMARQAGMDIAKGEYIKHLDSDDVLDLKACEICYDEAKKDNVDILYHGAYNFCSGGKKWVRRNFGNRLITKQIFQWISGSVCFGVYKSSFIKDNNLNFSESGNMGEDMSFNMIALPQAKRIKTISDLLYSVRKDNLSSLTHTIRGKQDAQSRFHNVKKVYNVWKESGYFEKQEAKTSFLKYALNANYSPDNYEIDKMFLSVVDKMLLDGKTVKLLSKNEKQKLKSIMSVVKKGDIVARSKAKSKR